MIKLEKSSFNFSDSEDLITYTILDNEEPIGSIELYETDSPDLLVIDFIKIPESLGSRTREVIRALKRIYPKVTRLKSFRTTGSYNESARGDVEDSITEVKI